MDDSLETFYDHYKRLLAVLNVRSVEQLRSLESSHEKGYRVHTRNEWLQHILPLQRQALRQRADPRVQDRLLHKTNQGRPLTILPLWSETCVPLDLLLHRDPFVRKTLFVSDKKLAHLHDMRCHTKKEDAYGYPITLYFNPFLLMAGEVLRARIMSVFAFNSVEVEAAHKFTEQFDKKLAGLMRLEERQRVRLAPAMPLSDDEDEDRPASAAPAAEPKRKRPAKAPAVTGKRLRVHPSAASTTTVQGSNDEQEQEVVPDPKVAYGQVDDKELYEGLLLEEPGAVLAKVVTKSAF